MNKKHNAFDCVFGGVRKPAFTLAEGASHGDVFDGVWHLGFTLAEVLITLGIIGVVAAMTLPTFINKTQDRINRNRLKREYSLYQQAFNKIIAENDIDFRNAIMECVSNNSSGHKCIKDSFKAKMKVVADCDSNSGQNSGKCFVPQAKARQLNGKIVSQNAGYFNNDQTSGFVLDDGSSVAFWLDDKNCGMNYGQLRCGWFVVDVNGANGNPNQWGKDLFLFFITPTRIMPADSKFTDNANNNGFVDDCEVGTNYGLTCASKYLYK